MALKLVPAPVHPPPSLGNYCLFSGCHGIRVRPCRRSCWLPSEAREARLLRILSTGAASPERPRLRHGLRGLGRHLAATSAPRPHRGTPQRPRAQIQAATEHR